MLSVNREYVDVTDPTNLVMCNLHYGSGGNRVCFYAIIPLEDKSSSVVLLILPC